MRIRTYRSGAFTIVELLIVIVVIGILAAITTVAYSNVQSRSKESVVAHELKDFYKAIYLARINREQSLYAITGSNHTSQDGGCFTAYPGTYTKTHSCWTVTTLSLQRIAAAAEVNLGGLIDGDPWGAPYYLDENEEDNFNNEGMCRDDVIGSYKNPFPGTSSGYALANGGTTGYAWVRNPIIIPNFAANCP
jgi:prepilin-type N-terminal cleavage/methylation domain-containing protein